jgi:hypothetical protein
MNDDGLLMMNVFDEGKDGELLFALAATMRRVFPSVMVESRGANYMLFAFTRRQSPDHIRQRLTERVVAPPLRDARISEIVPPPAVKAFTDNLAPVEEMTRRMLTAR